MTTRLRIAFAGTPEIASRILDAINHKNEHDIELVFTQPDRPAGRGRPLKPSDVKQFATTHNFPVYQPETTKTINIKQLAKCDLMLVIAYGLLLSEDVLNAPRLGCINIHTSLLPRWRGAAPIQRAIEAGDDITGISIMQMEKGLDTGPVLFQKSCGIDKNETAGSLHDKLVMMSIEAIHPLLNNIATDKINTKQQDDNLANYAHKISKQDARLDWNKPAVLLERQVRAFNPFPICHTELNGMPIRIWSADVKPHCQGEVGEIINTSKESIDVVTSDGVLAITSLQIPGKTRVDAKAFLNGHPDFLNSNTVN